MGLSIFLNMPTILDRNNYFKFHSIMQETTKFVFLYLCQLVHCSTCNSFFNFFFLALSTSMFMCRYPHLFFVISPKSMRDVKFHSSLQIN